MTKDSIAHVHILCEEWLRELAFYKSEIPYLRKRLEEIASKNTSAEIMKEVDHYENKFKILSTHIDELIHDVKLKNESLLKEAAAKPNYINVKMVEADHNLLDLMSDTSSDFYETKSSFYKFLSRTM
jgi:predicted nuclease with TOPRIM domain